MENSLLNHSQPAIRIEAYSQLEDPAKRWPIDINCKEVQITGIWTLKSRKDTEETIKSGTEDNRAWHGYELS